MSQLFIFANRKRRLANTNHHFILAIVTSLILCALLFGIWNLPLASADNNLASIPNAWGTGYEPLVPKYSYIDDVIKFNGEATIRLEKGGMFDAYQAIDRAIWTNIVHVSSGDEIYVSAWIRTEPSSFRDRIHGARIGIDFYAGNKIVDGDQSAYVRWNTTDWTLREISVTVPTTLYEIDDSGNSAPIDGVTFWLQALNGNDAGTAWFAHTLFYLNPTEIVQPTPATSPTPLPTVTLSPTPTLTIPTSTLPPTPTKTEPGTPQITQTTNPVQQTPITSAAKTASPTAETVMPTQTPMASAIVQTVSPSTATLPTQQQIGNTGDLLLGVSIGLAVGVSGCVVFLGLKRKHKS